MYEKILKPVLFRQDAEETHNKAIFWGELFGKFTVFKKLFSLFFNYKNDKLNINVLGVDFENPVGLAAGFDKDARLTQILPEIGFGFEEIGSIAGSFCKGNEKPRVFRLPKDKSLVINYGLKSEGSEVIFNRLKNKKFKFPIGINIVRANNPDIVMDVNKGIKDYIKAYNNLKTIGDYITINISCPNTPDDRAFSSADNFNKLMGEFGKLKINKPVFIKLKPDFSKKEVDDFLEVCSKHAFVKGFVISNLSKDRSGLKSGKEEIDKTEGGFSGLPVKNKSDELLKYVYKKTKGKYVLIGCGGIFSAEDAYKKIKNGASLVQLITSMIYKGPSVIKEINKGLVKLLEKDGFDSIKDAIGSNL